MDINELIAIIKHKLQNQINIEDVVKSMGGDDCRQVNERVFFTIETAL